MKMGSGSSLICSFTNPKKQASRFGSAKVNANSRASATTVATTAAAAAALTAAAGSSRAGLAATAAREGRCSPSAEKRLSRCHASCCGQLFEKSTAWRTDVWTCAWVVGMVDGAAGEQAREEEGEKGKGEWGLVGGGGAEVRIILTDPSFSELHHYDLTNLSHATNHFPWGTVGIQRSWFDMLCSNLSSEDGLDVDHRLRTPAATARSG